MGVESKGSGQIPTRRYNTSRQGPQPLLADFHPGCIRISQAGRGLVNRLLSALASRPTVSGIKGKRISLGCYAMSNPAVVFNSLDSDKSGGIEVDELRMACDQMGLGLDEKQVHELMDALDTDGNRTISMDEFKELSHLVQGKYRRGQGRCADPGNPEGLSNVFAMYNELERLVNMRRPPELIQQLFGALMLLVYPEDACTRQEMSWASFRRWIELLGGDVGVFIDNLQLYDISTVSASLVSRVKSHLRRWGLIPDAPSLLQGVAPAAANALCIWLWDNIAMVSPSDPNLPPDSAKWASPYRPTLKDKKPSRPLTASTLLESRSSAAPRRPKSARPASHTAPFHRAIRRTGSAGKRPNQRDSATSGPSTSRSASKLVRPFSARLPSNEVFTPETCLSTKRPETAAGRRGGQVSVHTNALAGSSGQWPGLGVDPQAEVMVELKPRIVQLHCLLDTEANGKVAAAELDPLLASHSSAIAQMVAGADRQWVDVESLLQLFARVAQQKGMPMARSLLRHLQAAVGEEVSKDVVKPARITMNEARQEAIQRLFQAAGGVPNGTLPKLRLQRAASATSTLANLADLVEHTLTSDHEGQVELQSLESFFTLYAQQRGLIAADSLMAHLQRGLGVLIERGEFEAPEAEEKEAIAETLESEDIQQILCLHASASGSEDGVEVAVLEAAFALETGQLVTPTMQKLSPLAENGLVPEANLIRFFSDMCIDNGRAATVHVITQLERGLQRHTQLEHIEPTIAPADQLTLVRRHTTADSPQGALSRLSAAPQSPAQRRASVPTVIHTDMPKAPPAPNPEPEHKEEPEPEPELAAIHTDTPKAAAETPKAAAETPKAAAETPKAAVPVESKRRTSVKQALTADDTAADEDLPAFCSTHSSVSAASLATPLPEDLGAMVLQLFWAHDKDSEGKVPKPRFDHIAPEPHAFDSLQSDEETGLVGVSDFVDFFDCMHQHKGVNAIRELLTELLAKSHWREVHRHDSPTEQRAVQSSHHHPMPTTEQQPDAELAISRPQSRQSNIDPIHEEEELEPADQPNTAGNSIEAIREEHEVKANHPSRPESRVSLSGSDIPDDLGVLVLQIFWAMDEQNIGKIQKEAFDEIDPTGSVFNGFKSMGTDANGCVDIEEFVNYFNVMVASQGHDSVKAILDKLQNHFDWERRSQISSSRPSSRFSSGYSRPDSQQSAYTTGLESELDSKSERESWHSWEDRTDSHSWNRPHLVASTRPPRPESARVRPGSAVRTRTSRPDRPESARVRMEGANGRPARYSRPNSAYSRGSPGSSRRPSSNYSSRPSSRFSRPDSATSRTSAASSQLSSVDFPSELGLRLLHIFWALDDTGRGAVSKIEIEDLNDSGVRFDDLDTDDNGFVDIDEFVAFFNILLADEGQEAVEKLLSGMEAHFELG